MQFKNSISIKLLKKVFLIYFAITFIVTSAQILIEYYDTKNSIYKELVSLENIFSQSLKNAIWDMNVDQINSLSRSIYSLTIIKEVIITDASGNVLFQQSAKDISKKFSHEFNIYNEYNDKTVFIAKAVISSDNNSVIDVVKTGIYLILLNAIIKSTILWFLFMWAFKITLTKPLKDITEQIGFINFDNMDYKKISVDLDKESELYLLQNKFNSMIEKITEQKNTILNIKESYLIKLESEVKERTIELEKSNFLLTQMAATDYLTGIKNRRSFYEMSEQYLLISKRNSTPLCVLMCDIDNFKSINDRYGHKIGDEALKAFAKKCENILRQSDLFGRIGGEEFAITLLDTQINNAQILAEKIIKHTSEILIDNNISFTVSIGVAQIQQDDNSIDDIMARADKALYQAKKNGRNRAVLSEIN